VCHCDIYEYGKFQQKPVVMPFREQKILRKVRVAAKLPEVRIHDLRHSFASVALPVATRCLTWANCSGTLM
jgi:integrase